MTIETRTVRRGRTASLLLLWLTATASGPVAGADAQDQPPDGESAVGRSLADFQGGDVDGPPRRPGGAATFPQVWCEDITDPATSSACWNAYRAGLDYYETGLRHRTRVIAWQHLSTRVIFVVVLALVTIGIYFAWVQFRRGGPPQAHELEITMKGFKISSPVLGLIILVISLAFFYLYLVYVYPIQEII